MDYIWSGEVLCAAHWERKGAVPSPSGVLQHAAAYSGYGRRAGSVNRLRWLRMVFVDIPPLWRIGVSATVLVDGLHWSHGCLRPICQSCDGVVSGSSPLRRWLQVVPSSCRRCLDHRIVECGILKRLAPSAVLEMVCSMLNILSLLMMVRP